MHVVDLPPDVSEPPNPALADYHAARIGQARAELMEAVRATVPAACAAFELVVAGKPYREILRVAGEEEAE